MITDHSPDVVDVNPLSSSSVETLQARAWSVFFHVLFLALAEPIVKM
jgi:hypothetical protein